MPRYPSNTILVTSVVGEARELIAVEEARLQLNPLGRMFYNIALGELHAILGYIDEESLLTETQVTDPTISNKYYSKDLAEVVAFSNLDKVKTVYAFNGRDVIIEGFPVSVTELVSHRASGAAKYPYEDGLVYTEVGTNLMVVFGNNLTLNSPSLYAVYKRQPSFVTKELYTTAYIDVPDKYYPLLALRIASLAELRNGVTEKALVLVKQSYEQLLAAVDPAIKSKLMDSLTYKPTTIGSNVGEK